MALKMPGRRASRFESEMGDQVSDTRHYMYSFIRVKRTIQVLVYRYIADGVKIGGQVLKVAEDNNVW